MIDVLRPLLCTLYAKWSEVKNETPFRYAHTETRTRVVVICDPVGLVGLMDDNMTLWFVYTYADLRYL